MIVCLLMMLAVLMLGTSAAQIAIQEEKASRNGRDGLIALQAAEAALKDAELDIETLARANLFALQNSKPVAGTCEGGLGNPLLGLCHPASRDAPPVWHQIDMADGDNAISVPHGFFTGRDFPTGGNGAPASSPRYIIEALAAPEQSQDGMGGPLSRMYRVTAIGYGSKQSVQAVLQTYYRKSSPEAAGLRTGRLSWREILNWEEMRSVLERE